MIRLRFAAAFLVALLPAAAQDQLVSPREAVARMEKFGNGEFTRGEALYNRVCAACHGTKDAPAAVPNSRIFHQQPMLNGADPWSLYQTLEKGYNQMIPQPWMDPMQKLFVIHYLRENFFKETNASQYVPITEDYLATLPTEKTLKLPKQSYKATAVTANQYQYADYGPHLFGHFEITPNLFAYKGLILPLETPVNGNLTGAKSWALYDLDTLRLAAVWDDSFIDWNDLQFNGKHLVHAKITGPTRFVSDERPAWSVPGTTSFADPRDEALDTRRYGPLPKDHARYLGLEADGTLHYEVAGIAIEETIQPTSNGAVQRTLTISPHSEALHHLAGPAHAAVRHHGPGEMIRTADGLVLTIPPSNSPQTVHLFLGAEPATLAAAQPADADARAVPPADTRSITSPIKSLDSPLTTSEIVVPQFGQNPWNAWIRPSGIDFLSDGATAIVASWMGDVFRVENAAGAVGQQTTWIRIASGLHQPLGLKVVDDQIYVGCRDQIVRLIDKDGDHRTDFYEAFNTDHQVSIHFHEFAAGLDADSKGNFYYVKAGRHDKPAVFEQHGTLIRVAPDGSSSEIVANGFRSANGIFVDRDDTVWGTDQEGHWHPQNRINRILPGRFYGNMLGAYDPYKTTEADEDMQQPIVWVPKNFENSPSEVFRFPDQGWGPLNGQLAYLSYALGRIMMLPSQPLDLPNASDQAATFPLPIPDFPTGVMRARIHRPSNDVFLCGLFGWGSQRVQDAGIYRLSFNDAPLHIPTGFEAKPGSLTLTLSDPVSPATADPAHFTARSFTIERSRRYGSKLENESPLEVTAATLGDDHRTLTLEIPSLAPTRILNLRYSLVTESGEKLDRELSATIHALE